MEKEYIPVYYAGARCGVSEARRIGDSVVVVTVGDGHDLLDGRIRGETGGGNCAAKSFVCTSCQ